MPSALTVKDRLYIDGGEIYSLTKGKSYGSTYVVDLKKSWTTSTLSGTGYTRDKSFAAARRPQLFYDESHDIVYSQAGQVYGPIFSYAEPEVWGFKPDDKADGTVTWSEVYSASRRPHTRTSRASRTPSGPVPTRSITVWAVQSASWTKARAESFR